MSELERRLEAVVAELGWLPGDVMLFGAGVLPLYIDRALVADDLRPTEDVDALIRLTAELDEPSGVRVARIEGALRHHGWSPDVRSHRRNVHAYVSPSGVPVDLVFEDLYPSDDWVVVSAESAQERTLASGVVVRIPSPAMFLVCKVAASRNPKRWEGAYDSHDLEDIAALLAGCSGLVGVAGSVPSKAAEYLKAWSTELLDGSTTYGQQAYACLEGNWPRGVGFDDLDVILRTLAGR